MDDLTIAQTKHHPTVYNANRLGAWITCSCGWKSRTYVGVTGAHLAFGEHLTKEET